MSSVYGLIGSDVGHAPYTANKHGVIGLTKSAAIDYGDRGVRVNAVCPSYIHSGMVDPYVEALPDLMANVIRTHSAMNRLGEPDEVARAVAWLPSDEASFINGVALTIGGGDTTKLY